MYTQFAPHINRSNAHIRTSLAPHQNTTVNPQLDHAIDSAYQLPGRRVAPQTLDGSIFERLGDFYDDSKYQVPINDLNQLRRRH